MSKELDVIKTKINKLLVRKHKIDEEIKKLKLREEEILKNEFYIVYEKSNLSYEEFIEKISKQKEK